MFLKNFDKLIPEKEIELIINKLTFADLISINQSDFIIDDFLIHSSKFLEKNPEFLNSEIRNYSPMLYAPCPMPALDTLGTLDILGILAHFRHFL